MRQALIGAGFSVIGTTGLHRLMPDSLRGLGAILMFHHVRPASANPFAPNGLLEITPEFLEAVLLLLRRLDYDIVTLDEAARRLTAGPGQRRFAVLTFDDGYRDNALYAIPILARHAAPFTLFVTPGFADLTARLWWVELEEVIRGGATIDLEIGGERLRLRTATPAEKQAAWNIIYARLRLGSEDRLNGVLDRLCDAAAIDRAGLVAKLCLGWDDLLALGDEPLATIGAHTVSHPRLAKLPEAAMRHEMETSRAILAAKFARPVRHFAYPIGDRTSAGPREFEAAREAGFTTAVTTRPGLLFADHAEHLTALPRLSVNGLWQDPRNMDVLLSGTAYAIWNRGRRVNAA